MIPKLTIALLLALATAFAACSDDDGQEQTQTPAETTPPAATETAGPSETPPSEPTATPDPGPATDAAVEALATWLGPVADPAAIEVTAIEAVTWPDGCLGLDRAGLMCTDALVEGFRVELTLGDGTYEVRTDLTGDLAVWAPTTQIMAAFAECLTNLCTFTTDDGNTLEAQPVFGTDFGVDPQTLSAGDPVGVALAEAPQAGPQLLVWLDPVQE